MKKLLLSGLLLSSVLMSVSATAEDLPLYTYTVEVTKGNTVQVSAFGHFTPVYKPTEVTATVNNVAKKLKYDFSTISESSKDSHISFLMYMTESDEYNLETSISGCGHFKYSSIGIPKDKPLVLDGDNNCKLKVTFSLAN